MLEWNMRIRSNSPALQWISSDAVSRILNRQFLMERGLVIFRPRPLQSILLSKILFTLLYFLYLFIYFSRVAIVPFTSLRVCFASMDNQTPLPYSSAAPSNAGQPSHHPEPSTDEYSPQLPLSDQNNWYYPSHGYESENEMLESGSRGGNWGNKTVKGARWVRRGKIASWGPAMDDWEAEERARKRIKLLLPQERRSPSPPTIPHLQRSPSPPLVSPYPAPDSQHLSYASFVMDKSVTHTFRSNLLDELEHATNGLIEGEASMRRALGRLWQVMSEDPDEITGDPSLVPKQEDEDGDADDDDDRTRRLARAPDLTPPVHKLFLLSYPSGGPPVFEPSHFASPKMQLESLEKSLATLRELQDDGREYVERLQEIREGLGDVRAQRNGVWDLVRERAVKELHEVAFNATG
ncbi:hypothetical protein D9615_005156 [Tricholomella constricta]|uniref:Uncharacterized protein n=1 Tax=Tricholomella constricta TaxID=117010 RepID=A0A8H5H6D8_9AGAR|nr:hypothetical protein D9615_005156 [Tricholomella constricta]